MGFFYPDVMLEVQDLIKVFCLAVCDETYASADFSNDYGDSESFGERLLGIALVPVPGCMGSFRRVGLVRWMKKTAFEPIKWSYIKMI